MDAQTYYQNQIIKVKKSQLRSAKVMLKRAKEWNRDAEFTCAEDYEYFGAKEREWKDRVTRLNKQISEMHKAS